MIEATGKAVEKVVNGFTGSPAMLLVVILNIALISMTGYAMLRVTEQASQGRTQIMSVLETCIAGGSDHGPISRKE